jgi:NAD(P)-dependent dehydrogenase (short-subunit alcohol dehydrogenase family)
MEVILLGAINFYRHIIPLFKKEKAGTVINFLTTALNDPVPPRMSSYITAKAGLKGFTQTMSVELEHFDIKVLTISPSYTETALLSAFPDKLLEMTQEKLASKQFLQPEELTILVEDIINTPSKYKNGSDLIINDREDINRFVNQK